MRQGPPRTKHALVAILTALLVAGLGVVVVTSSTGAASGACSRTPTYKVKIRSSASDYAFDSNRTPSGTVVQSTRFFRKDVDAGTTTLTYDMCKVASTGKWKVQRLIVAAPHKDLAVTWVGKRMQSIRPATGNTGFGVFIRSRSASSVSFDATRCTRKPAGLGASGYAGLKALLNLPWKVPNPIAVGMYVVGQALPDAPDDKYWCMRMGDSLTLGVKFRKSDGRPVVQWPSSGHVGGFTKTAQTEYPCGGETYQYCSRSYRQVLWLRKS